jgi:hypothetical protein
MAHLQIRDNAIWFKHIEGDERLRERILRLRQGATIDLEVDGVVGRWVKMQDGKDGRSTDGLRPVGPMREVWKGMQARRGAVVPIRAIVSADAYLDSLRPLLSEWDSPEDDEAFRDL